MNNVLIVTSSARGEESVSSRLADTFAEQLRSVYPKVRLVRRDVGADPIPHLTPATMNAIRGEPATPEEIDARALSDELIEELRSADLVVIGSPMYNFGMSSTLKTWFDHVLRAGQTFRYTAEGPEGLLKGKKAIVIEARAGFYSEGAAAAMDFQEPHLRGLLGFMGIEDIDWVRSERHAFGPEAAQASLAEAADRLRSLAVGEVALAA